MKSNNPIIRHRFTADPTVLIHNDTIYLYACHDEAPVNADTYKIREWLCYSSNDLVHWTDHGVTLSPATFQWAGTSAYATKAMRHNDKFYWFAAASDPKHPKRAIGIAVSDSPTGPFTDAKGSPLIDHSHASVEGSFNMDPGVLMDSGEPYIFWGQNTCYFSKLSQDLLSLEGDIRTIDLPGFLEGVHIHRRNGWYYLSYGYQYPERIAYAMSRNIDGPWKFQGILNDYAYNCETNRPCIIDFRGKSYFFYHNGALPEGGSFRRSICVDYLHYNEDGTIPMVSMTSTGVEEV